LGQSGLAFIAAVEDCVVSTIWASVFLGLLMLGLTRGGRAVFPFDM